MRRIPRLPPPTDLAHPAPHPRRFSTTTTARAAAKNNTSAPFTERLRSKIWGTAHAPGREDPYSLDSPMRAEQRAAPPRRAAAGAVEPQQEQRPVRPRRNAYKPAKTWHGLQRVGGGKNWPQQVPEHDFVRAAKMSEKREIAAALRRALVEVYAAKGKGEAMEMVYNGTEDASVGFELRAAEDGSAVITERGFEHQTASIGEAAEQVGASPEEVKAWTPISLRDPEVKFTVVKRLMQLTGLRISDPVIAESSTAGILLNQITAREQPKKLAEKLEHNHQLVKLPNVKISGRRITPIDKEKAVGRWKVIEQKLLDKNLPVTGHNI